jgi:hypothetical protein
MRIKTIVAAIAISASLDPVDAGVLPFEGTVVLSCNGFRVNLDAAAAMSIVRRAQINAARMLEGRPRNRDQPGKRAFERAEMVGVVEQDPDLAR